MTCRKPEWEPTKVEYESVDWSGNSITLQDIPAEVCKKCNEVRIPSSNILVAEQKYLANKYNLELEHLPILLILHAKSRFIKPDYLEQKFRFHKMLFYFERRLSEKGWKRSYIHDVFGAARSGPVAIHLNELTKSLEEKGLVDVKWAKKPGESFRWELTAEGKKLAEELWQNTPDEIRRVVQKVKRELFLLDANQLRDKVHEEYPEYKKFYKVAYEKEHLKYEQKSIILPH